MQNGCWILRQSGSFSPEEGEAIDAPVQGLRGAACRFQCVDACDNSGNVEGLLCSSSSCAVLLCSHAIRTWQGALAYVVVLAEKGSLMSLKLCSSCT